MTPNPAPEPGQHVWIAAEAWYPDGWKSPLLCPLGTDGQPKKRDGFGVGAVVWHPADVPPQPPVLADDALREQVAAMLGLDVDEGWMTIAGPLMEWAVGVRDAPLADVPGPDDTTPTPGALDLDAIRSRSSRAAGAQGWLDSPPDRADEPGLEPHAHEVIAASANDVPALLAEIDRLRSAPAAEPPPSGEGAALIAATEQEIAEAYRAGELDGDELESASRAAWEATARRLARDLDAHGAPVQATTHGEAGEAQKGVQGAMLCDAINPFNELHRCTLGLGHPVEVAHTDGDATWLENPSPEALAVAERFRAVQGARPNASQPVFSEPECKPEPRNLNSVDVDSVQGAGRDWRGEICHVLEAETGTEDKPGWWIDVADAIVVALGLHDLEQAAAEAPDWDAVARRLAAVGLLDLDPTDPQGMFDRIEQWIGTLRDQGLMQSRVIQQYSAERDRARKSLEANKAGWAFEIKRTMRLEDLRRDVVMAMCLEDGDEERTDTEVVERVRQLVASDMGAAQEIDAERHAAAAMERERDAARRELEQLRGMVEEVAERVRTKPALDTAPYIYSWLHAALAATAPATQDGADRG